MHIECTLNAPTYTLDTQVMSKHKIDINKIDTPTTDAYTGEWQRKGFVGFHKTLFDSTCDTMGWIYHN